MAALTNNLLNALPQEVLMHMAEFLDVPALGNLSQADKASRDLFNDTVLWRKKCREEGIEVPLGTNPKDAFRNALNDPACVICPRANTVEQIIPKIERIIDRFQFQDFLTIQVEFQDLPQYRFEVVMSCQKRQDIRVDLRQTCCQTVSASGILLGIVEQIIQNNNTPQSIALRDAHQIVAKQQNKRLTILNPLPDSAVGAYYSGIMGYVERNASVQTPQRLEAHRGNNRFEPVDQCKAIFQSVTTVFPTNNINNNPASAIANNVEALINRRLAIVKDKIILPNQQN